MTRLYWMILAACLAAGLAGYALTGRPGMGDQPMSARQAALAERIRTEPEALTPAEMFARLEQATREQPDAAEPHYFIGEMLRAQGRIEDAARAYQSSLRRDPAFVPALIGLADALVELRGGSVGPDATRLYGEAYRLDETQVRAGMRAALGAAEAGEQERAEQAMAYILSRLPEDDPRRTAIEGMLAERTAN